MTAYMPYSVYDLQNKYTFNKVSQILACFREYDEKVEGGCMIIEEIGSTLEMQSHSDVTGNYVKYRLTPFMSHLPRPKQIAAEVAIALTNLLTTTKTRGSSVTPGERENEFIVHVHQGTYSIGD